MNHNFQFIIKLRESRLFKKVIFFVAINLFFQLVQPTISLALTEGPSQPEVQSFEPINTTQMVDLFTGDFNYNIPLFNLPGPNGGYPVNLSYHAGSSMDDEASWVGLGWNINVGSLVRNVRGIPDEFKSEIDPLTLEAKETSDYIEVKSDMKKNWTFGVNLSESSEIFGGTILDNEINNSLSIYYNNYNGVGFKIGQSASFGGSPTVSFGYSLDTENGLGIDASVSLEELGTKKHIRDHKLGVSFDGNLSLNYSLTQSDWVASTPTGHIKENQQTIGNSISFARSVFNPSFGLNIDNYNLSFNVSVGTNSITGFDPEKNYGLFFNTQDLSNVDKKGRKQPVSGYNTMGDIELFNLAYTLDFERYNDGQITKSNSFLPNSSYTYDVFNSTGQGMISYFRPRRNDVGGVYDPLIINSSKGASLGLQYDSKPPGQVIGGDVGANWGYNKQAKWVENNELSWDFQRSKEEGLKENLYYQAHGESTIIDYDELRYMNYLNLPEMEFSPNEFADGDGPGKRYIRGNTSKNQPYSNEKNLSNRVTRNTLVHTLLNNEISKGANGEQVTIGEFNIKYYQDLSYSSLVQLNRKERNSVDISNHPGGYKILNSEGSYYVYGLPAYNNLEVENTFSIPGLQTGYPKSTSYQLNNESSEVDYKNPNTDKYIRKVKKSPYAHSYLLTSVLGADYVDINNNGPTDDDLGYWVKFDYLKYADNYKWRTPYSKENEKKAFYNKGQFHDRKDDKASYSYGEKEVWYLAKIETKTHIAEFIMTDERNDSRESAGEHGNGTISKSALQLKKIKVYEKKSYLENQANAVPLQEIHFEYHDQANELCKGIPNAEPFRGKLTLKSVFFKYNGSERGSKNKYEFEYTQNNNFIEGAYDMWGTYKPTNPENAEFGSNFPYVNQFNQNWNAGWNPNYTGVYETDKLITKESQDKLASSWCLNKIHLPSGGTINIDYESDDYAYVQHKVANQMFKIQRIGDDIENPNQLYESGNSNNYYYNEDSFDDELRRRVYFKLEEPLPSNLNEYDKAKFVYDKYVKPLIKDENGNRNLYVKTKMNLTFGTGGDYSEYIRTYLPLEENFYIQQGGESHFNYGVSNDGLGFVTIQAAKRKNGQYFDNYHPLALAGWTYMQTNANKLLNNYSMDTGNDFSNLEVKALLDFYDFIKVLPATAASFGAIRPYCKANNFCKTINLDFSCIKLASPDKVKYGGGHRVKQISITDNWSFDTQETDRTYGQKFDYTTTDEEGNVISSGVAQYEPQAGGDENALKYPFYYFDKQTTFTNNNLFTEAPINEALYPGPSVGYSKVSISSLNTAKEIKRKANEEPGLFSRTGGVAVHEFYTAKDFPTITKHSLLHEENNTKDVFNVPIFIPLVGSFIRKSYHGIQAYMIELNDMHGKPKSVKTYDTENYQIGAKPLTESQFIYQAQPFVLNGENVFKLVNDVSVISNNGLHQINPEKKLLGVEAELFTDQRESVTKNNAISFDPNVDIPFIAPVPTIIPSFWMTFDNTKIITRTYVTNKVIHRSGVLKKTISRDLQTSNESEIIAYDEKSGIPMLSKMTNEFGDDFYSYNIPAYYHYDRMGHAFENIGYNFRTVLTKQDHGHSNEFVYIDGNDHLNILKRGDELLIKKPKNENSNFNKLNETDELKKAYFIGWFNKINGSGGSDLKALLHIPSGYTSSNNVEVELKIIRSGNRNQFGTPIASYLMKGNQLNNLESYQYIEGDLTVNTFKFDKNSILNASATIFNDNWTNNYSLEFLEYDPQNLNDNLDDGDGSVTTINEGGAVNRIKNPFLMGISGIWRAEKSYSYVGPRKSSGSTNKNEYFNLSSLEDKNPELFNDGVFTEHVPFFTWDLGNIEQINPRWEWVNEVTRYSDDSYETENVNRLNIFSSALYGYNNSLSIGVGGNAGYFELGFDDFETFNLNQNHLFYNKRMEQNNLNFNPIQYSNKTITTEILKITNARYTSEGLLNLDVKLNSNNEEYIQYFLENCRYLVNGNNYLNTTFGITLKSKKQITAGNLGYFFNGVIKEIKRVDREKSLISIVLKPFYHCVNEDQFVLTQNQNFYGTLTMFERRNMRVQNQSSQISVSNTKYHTGKKSLMLSGESLFDHPKLKAYKGKKYIWSMWISRDNIDQRNYFTYNDLVSIGKIDANGQFININPISITKSKNIEGWQKIDIEFEVDVNYPVLALRFNAGNEKLYLDDIRFSPKTGGVTTYVYDPIKFWLKANLNVDNYATYFFYDEQGNLSLKKQETEKGIFTLTESRGHVIEK